MPIYTGTDIDISTATVMLAFRCPQAAIEVAQIRTQFLGWPHFKVCRLANTAQEIWNKIISVITMSICFAPLLSNTWCINNVIITSKTRRNVDFT